jgi:hypothetical protein
MDAMRVTRGRSVTGTRTTALVVLLLLCAGAVMAACGSAGTATSSSPSPGEVAASVAASPSTTPLPRGAGRGTIAFTKVHLTTVAYEQGPADPLFDIYVVHNDGSGLRRLAAGARGPAWSPDGARIAYTSPAAACGS